MKEIFRGFKKRNILLLIVGLGLLLGGLTLYFGFFTTYLHRISIHENTNQGIKLHGKTEVISSEGKGAIVIETEGMVSIPAITRIGFWIRSQQDSKWMLQQRKRNGFDVRDGFFRGSLEFGSIEYPMQKDEEYFYQITDGILENNRVISTGTISVKTFSILGINPVYISLITALSIIAATFQIGLVGFELYKAHQNKKVKLPQSKIKSKVDKEGAGIKH